MGLEAGAASSRPSTAKEFRMEPSGARRSIPVRRPCASRAASVEPAPDLSSGRRGVPGRRRGGVGARGTRLCLDYRG